MKNKNVSLPKWALTLLVCQSLHVANSQEVASYARNTSPQKSILKTAVYSPDQENKENKQTLQFVLTELNKVRGIYFLLPDQSVANRLVNYVSPDKGNVEKILTQVLFNTGLQYRKVNDKTFVIQSPRDTNTGGVNSVKSSALTDALMSSENRSALMPPPVTVTGKITSPDGKPLSGVNVAIKGSSKGVITNLNGDFTIQANEGDILVFSSIGYASFESKVAADGKSLKVVLKESATELNTVVVTALGIKKQTRSLGYSTTEVDGSKFTQSREANIGNALTGQVAGVSVAGTATGPSGSSRVTIRGNASLSGNNQPLYVIDGVPYDNTNQGAPTKWGGLDYGDGLSNINSDDIESIQILKGVAASALYGYRGGNGAILITTKSGTRSRGLGIEVNNNLTANNVVDERDYQYEYGQGVLGVMPTSAAAAQNSEYFSWGAKMDPTKQATNFLGNQYAYAPAKDNFKNFYKTGIVNQTSIALLGGNDQGHFRLGLSNLYNGAVIPNSNMKQQGVNFNSGYNITSKLQLNLTANYIFEQVKNRVSFSDAPGNVVASTLYLGNTFDVRWLSPRVNATGGELLPGQDTYFNNPYFVAYNFQNSTKRERFTGGLNLKYNLLDWLYIQGGATRDGYNFDLTNILPTGTGYAPGGQMTVSTVIYHEMNYNFMLGVNKKLNNDLTLNASFGGNSMDNESKSSGVTQAGPFVLPYFYSINNIANRPYTVGYKRYHVNSLYASADLGYKNFLFLNVTAREDWFSTLSINSNHYLYPSFSGSFVFSDVAKLPSWISYGKLRASYAQGSNGTTPYQNLLTYGLEGYTTNGQVLGYVNQTVVPNANLKPVKIDEKEIGLNMQFLHNRLGFDVAYYIKKTTDDIVQVTTSPTSGYNAAIQNIGKIQNKGVELLLTGVPVKAKNFAWNVSFNIAVNNSKVLALGPDGNPIPIAGAFPRWGNAVSISNVVGLPYGQIMGYAYKRDANGNKIFDASGNPEPTAGVVPLGSGAYKTTGGFTNEFHYKAFSFSFLIDYKYGAKIYSGTNLLLYNYGLQKTTLQGREGGYVGVGVTDNGQKNTTAVNAQTYFQNISTGGDNIAEEFVYDASFIKLRALTLGYSIPKEVLGRSFVKGVTFTLVARNLATLMKHTPNIDPESNYSSANGQGLELSGYPTVRSLGFNVNLKF